MNAKLNKRERRAAQLLAHYATCERLALHLGMLPYRYLAEGEIIRSGDECNDGKRLGGREDWSYAPAQAGQIGRRVDGSLTFRRPMIDGKKISVALWKIERDASNAATAQCNGEAYQAQPFRGEAQWEGFISTVGVRVAEVFGKLPPGFFVNGDPRGYALQVDCDDAAGKQLIDSVRLHRNCGGNGVLSPEITGD